MAFFLLFKPKGCKTDQSLYRRRIAAQSRALIDLHASFWSKYPLLLISIALLLGIASFHSLYFILFFPLLLISSYKTFFPFSFFLILLIGFLGAIYSFVAMPLYFTKAKQGKGIFYPTNIQTHYTLFTKGILYKGHFSFFDEEEKVFSTIPIQFFVKNAKKLDKKAYTFSAEIYPAKSLYHGCKVEKPFVELTSKKSWAWGRYLCKKKAYTFFKRAIKDEDSSHLLFALFTGEPTPPFIKYHFQRFGLTHLLVISGFHFSLIVISLLSLCKFGLSHRISILLLVSFCTAYFLFLGITPSIFRAYTMCTFYFWGVWRKKPIRALNILGASLFIELLFYPEHIFSLSMHLSFLSCFGIFCFYSFFSNKLSYFFPFQTKYTRKSFSLYQKTIYFFANYFREALALCFAVNILLIPLLLFVFQRLFLLSILYNLFIPPLIALAMSLVIASVIFFPLQSLLLQAAEKVCQLFFCLLYHPIASLEIVLYWKQMSLIFFYFLLSILFLLAPVVENYRKNELFSS